MSEDKQDSLLRIRFVNFQLACFLRNTVTQGLDNSAEIRIVEVTQEASEAHRTHEIQDLESLSD